MDIFEKIARKFKLVEEKSTTEQIMEKREDLKIKIAVSLYNKNFTDEEIDNVLSVIIQAEDKIKEIKDSLIGTNINMNENTDPLQPLVDGKAKIREISQRMNEEVRDLIAQYAKNHQS